MLKNKLSKYFGTKEFYKMVLMIAVPIMVQNGFTNFVNMLDNLMVGRVGTDEMSGVAIVNQLLFVFNLTIFGGLSGAGIFTSQFHGNGNQDGIKKVFRIKLGIAAAILAVGAGVLFFFQDTLIELFLHEGSETGDPAATMAFAKSYLMIMLTGLLPFSLNQCLTGTLREVGETVAPMKAGILAVLVNLVFNYLLIYGKLGFPALGVRGAAYATVLSRFVECAAMIIWLRLHKKEHPFAVKVFKSGTPMPGLTIKVLSKGLPLMINELLWSGGMTTLTQCYSTRGLAVIGAVNIANTINNVFNIIFIALGSSVSIIVGRLLGAGKMKEAKDTDTKMIVFSVTSCLAVAGVMAAVSPLFPKIYNTTDEVRSLATAFILIMALLMPVFAFNNAAYFTLRSGGKTFITMIFDSVFIWVVGVSTAFVLSRFTSMPIIPLYLCCQGADVLKCFFGFFFVKSNKWMQNIVEDR